MRQALELGWLTAYRHWYVENSTVFIVILLCHAAISVEKTKSSGG